LKVSGKGDFVDVFESDFGSEINGGAATFAICWFLGLRKLPGFLLA
jgi:hypothetical protein